MCHCNHFEVSSNLTEDGLVVQTCKNCGKQTVIPGTMSAVIKFMEERPQYRNNLEYIKMYFNKVM